ncbi:MAG: hypothetical protein IPJ19_20515 [Planctomycetes bacterium]|nr:hypothetical protein [Planctomycetota bacterium]
MSTLLGGARSWQSFLHSAAPWISLAGPLLLLALAGVLLARRVLRRRADALALRCLIAAVLLGLGALVDAVALGYHVDRGMDDAFWVVSLGALLLLLLLGFAVCTGCVAWRLISNPAGS